MLGAVAPGAPLLLGGVLAGLAGVVAHGVYLREVQVSLGRARELAGPP
jgi:hypothetical protein